MTKVLALAMIILGVAVSAQAMRPLTADMNEVRQPEVPPSTNVVRHFTELVDDLRAIYAGKSGDYFPCMWCTQLVTLAHNMTVDKALMADLERFLRVYLCKYWVPCGFTQYCMDYIDRIPDLLKAFADTYLDPTTDCAFLCQRSGADHPLNDIGNWAKKLRSAPSDK